MNRYMTIKQEKKGNNGEEMDEVKRMMWSEREERHHRLGRSSTDEGEQLRWRPGQDAR